MGRRWLCALLVAASVQLCLSSSTEGALAVTEFSEPAESLVVGESGDDATSALLKRMYHSIPYKAQCGSLAQEVANIQSGVKTSFAQCAAKCTSEFKCKAFEYDHEQKSCSMSPRRLLTKTAAGNALACSTRNVLITSAMRLPSKPDVFTKLASQVAEEEQEVAKEVKAGAKVEIQKTKAQVAQKVATLTEKVEQEKVQKMDAETKEKVEEANAVKQIHVADKLKTEIKHQASVKAAVAVEKKQARQALKTKNAEVYKLKKRLAESLSQAQSTQVAVEKAAQKGETGREIQQDNASSTPDLQKVRRQLAAVRSEIKDVKLKTTLMSKGAITCTKRVAQLEGVIDREKGAAGKQGRAAAMKAKQLTAKLAKMQAQMESANARQANEVAINQALQGKVSNLKDVHDGDVASARALALGLRQAENEARKNKDAMDNLDTEIASKMKFLPPLLEKGKLLEGCQQMQSAEKRDCAKKREQVFEKDEAKLSKRKAYHSEKGVQFDLCSKEVIAASAQASQMRSEIAKMTTYLAYAEAEHGKNIMRQEDEILKSVTKDVKQVERKRCDTQLAAKISKVSIDKPISAKCKTCATLSPSDQASLGVQCGECGR
jgi:hypothetical protein